ncbi:aminotransferase class I/II-fold pyridoxal phosphate-dependent enzyme [Burkholderia sp. Bp9031]|uniref:serine hydroxymethyltransferase n=1 Tax=Burkholderia sp. Bp9031 TaxID=2184566 RepID=UPI000F5E8577|nr:aminotransferase class I/II-fold pyridoxal phosphate-dependent enzyme [Burkholderia sp. Bp9031]RQZ12442.1 aminotransferase class I/II-fold pyridoxal phosphate-dependent enzyme [Burkholderia sp. Bp9031]
MLEARPWVPRDPENYIQSLVRRFASQDPDQNERDLLAFVEENRVIHERDCFNLNPATNAINPKAEALLAAGVGSRPSLGYPGDKYEMGLEGVEKIEVLCAELVAQVFGARYAEIRVASGALANLYAYMTVARPGDTVFVPSATVGGHFSHHANGAAGMYGVKPYLMAFDADRYTVDLNALREDALRLRPRVITLGQSLNLFPHPIKEVRAIADEVDAVVLYDAAHLCGVIAGHAWQQPLAEGAHLMTMSTYKSLAGAAGGLIVTNDAALAEKLDAIAYPGMTANFDAAKSASIAMTMLDWQACGRPYAAEMVDTARALADALVELGLPVFARNRGITTSHQFAIEAHRFDGGQAMARRLRRANILACGIGLPLPEIQGDVNGLRMGTPELVRWGMTARDMPQLAAFIADVLLGRKAPEDVAPAVSEYRRQFSALHYLR